MKVSELMNPDGVLLYAKIDNSADALGILVELQEGIGVITNGNAYYNAVSQRETFGGTTAIGGGIALPHACNAGVSAPGISALLLRHGVDWGAPDGEPVDLVFMIAVPPGSESLHLQILARLVNLLSRRNCPSAGRSSSSPPTRPPTRSTVFRENARCCLPVMPPNYRQFLPLYRTAATPVRCWCRNTSPARTHGFRS